MAAILTWFSIAMAITMTTVICDTDDNTDQNDVSLRKIYDFIHNATENINRKLKFLISLHGKRGNIDDSDEIHNNSTIFERSKDANNEQIKKLDLILQMLGNLTQDDMSHINTVTSLATSTVINPVTRDISDCQNYAGKEYILMFPTKWFGISTLQIYITSRTDATVDIESPHPMVNQTVQIKASQGRVVSVPIELMLSKYGVESKGILVRSNTDISVYGVTQEGSNRGEAYTAIPTRFLSQSYYTAVFGDSLISVVAFSDSTLVNVTYRSGYNSSSVQSFEISLSRLMTFQTYGYLLGTMLSSNKPIGVITGSRCFDHHYGALKSYCNQLLSYIPPTQSLGNAFIIPHITRGNYSFIHIESSQNRHCNLSIQGALFNKTTDFIGADQYSLQSKLPYIIQTTIPSIVVLYTSYRFSRSPPSKVIIPAISQYSNNYKFLTPLTENFDHYAIIMIDTNAVSGLMFDGQSIKIIMSDIQSINVLDTIYDVISFNITAGLHEVYHVDSKVTFGLICLGFTSKQAYAFPAGLYLGGRRCSDGHA